MSRTFADYYTKTALTLPEYYIDVKTGESIPVKEKVLEEIEYHTKNNTLIHLVLSALNDYLYREQEDVGTNEILLQLLEIKKMIEQKRDSRNSPLTATTRKNNSGTTLRIKDIEELLDAFGG